MGCARGVLLFDVFAIVCFAFITTQIVGACNSDLVKWLPNQPMSVPFKQYAGYVTVDEHAGRAFFYYFVEAEKDPSSKPLTLWLNGGPGCSSVGAGAFTEIGPFQARGSGLIRNNYAWNKETNLLFVESPAGVGFSYSNNTNDYQGLNDMKTAQDNFAFLLNWLNKFPHYKGRHFYITGESYAGHYIPQLADLVVKFMDSYGRSVLNLKAVAIGNPALDWVQDEDAVTAYYWSHGLNNDDVTKAVTDSCDWTTYLQDLKNGTVPNECVDSLNASDNQTGMFINSYDVILDVCLSESSMQAVTLHNMKQAIKDGPQISLGQDVCITTEVQDYLSRPDVQKALHANTTSLGYPWSLCSTVIKYDIVELFNHGTVHLLKKLVARGLRVFIYSGDQDSFIPLTGTRTIVDKLAKDLRITTTVPYSAWYEGGQVGGWTQGYSSKLTYATVRGASHMVPTSQPARGLTMFRAFIHDQALPSK